jgi:hypothetical protein
MLSKCAFEKIPTQLFRHDFESARMHIQGQCAKAERADRKAESFRISEPDRLQPHVPQQRGQ